MPPEAVVAEVGQALHYPGPGGLGIAPACVGVELLPALDEGLLQHLGARLVCVLVKHPHGGYVYAHHLLYDAEGVELLQDEGGLVHGQDVCVEELVLEREPALEPLAHTRLSNTWPVNILAPCHPAKRARGEGVLDSAAGEGGAAGLVQAGSFDHPPIAIPRSAHAVQAELAPRESRPVGPLQGGVVVVRENLSALAAAAEVAHGCGMGSLL
eukprot:CAMPEP_0173294634 /NCGR_PEP_ID=MMETSP1143-20121109/13989_1 /TAXON_ID=483371 /ORGANISM="non described non described, Strain CCMP2298" /LENGTH=211 /DNA_ID=CAMNT_0014234347 /DNA_START=489 /DNA_END=1120 /DNA_ORIENTATION=-